MSPRSDQPAFEAPGVPADAGLRCPQCGYNLTGLTENRCPECGSAFDPEGLRRLLRGEPMPIPGWDDRGDTNILVAFAHICWMTWFHPTRFAKAFPWHCNPSSVRAFARCSRSAVVTLSCVAGAVLCAIASALGGNGWEAAAMAIVFAGSVIPGALLASIVCEGMVSFVLEYALTNRGSCKREGARDSASSWWAVTVFHRSFLITTAVTLALTGALVIVPLDAGDGGAFVILQLVLAGNVIWWWFCLARVVSVRSLATPGRTLAVLLIPMVAMAAIFVMVITSAMFGMMLASLFQ